MFTFSLAAAYHRTNATNLGMQTYCFAYLPYEPLLIL